MRLICIYQVEELEDSTSSAGELASDGAIVWIPTEAMGLDVVFAPDCI